jgi:hypothetical protein
MLSFIPRLVVHKDEIDHIFFPDARILPRTLVISEGPVERTPPDQSESGEEATVASEVGNDAEASTSTPTAPPTFSGAMIRLVSQVPGTIVHIASELPFSVAQMASEIPTIHITSDMARETLRIPYRVLQDLPYRVVQLSSGVAREVVDLPFRVVQISSDMAREVVEMPHKASHNWRELSRVLSLLLFTTILVSGVVFFLPLSPASAGLPENRDFLYGVQTYYQALTLLPWIETCNFAMPHAKIPVRGRIITLGACLILQKLFDAFVAEASWGSVFPIPFSIFVSGALAFFLVVPMLYWTTPNREMFDFVLLWRVLCVYWVSLIMVGCWAVGMQRLEGRTALQTFVGFLFGPLRFVCKILLAAPVTTKLNPRLWIILNLVVDILFTRVQISTLPFIDGFVPLLLLFGTEVLTLLWRYYLGIDRLALWWTAINSRIAMRAEGTTEAETFTCRVLQEFGSSVIEVTTGCFSAPIPHISQLSLSVRNSLREAPPFDLRYLTTRTSIIEAGSAVINIVEESAPIEDGSASIDDDTASVEDGSSKLKNGSASIEHGSTTIKDGSANLPQSETDDFKAGDKDVETSLPEPGSTGTADEPLPQVETPTLQTPASAYDVLSEEHWEQRPLYHVIDAVGSTVINIIVRVNQQLSITLARNLPGAVHLTASFQASDERWKKAQIYSWIFIFLMLGLLASLGGIFFTRLERLQGGRRLTLSRVMTYLYRDHFWFFFLWLSASGGYVSATMIQHFGADFTLQFRWLECPNHIEWPGCAEL